MFLVPRQLQRHGMTGAVPYYGGRLTPAHVYAIQQQAREAATRPVPPPAPPSAPSYGAPPVPLYGTPPAPPARPAPLRDQRTPRAVLDSLTYLRDTGVITPQEFGDLRSRAGV